MPRIKTSNCVSCLVWFGAAKGGILPILIGMKKANAVPIAIGIAVIPIAIGTGRGESNEFNSDNEIRMKAKLFLE